MYIVNKIVRGVFFNYFLHAVHYVLMFTAKIIVTSFPDFYVSICYKNVVAYHVNGISSFLNLLFPFCNLEAFSFFLSDREGRIKRKLTYTLFIRIT